MTLAIIRDGAAVELAPGADVTFQMEVGAEVQDMTASWDSVQMWTEEERKARGIHTVVEANATLGANDKLGPPVLSFSNGEVTAKRAAVAMSAGEIAARKAELKDYAAAVRWAKEQGGLTLNGMGIKTDTEARVKVRELRDNMTAGALSDPFYFKATTGWVQLNLAAVNGVYAAIVKHVAATFATERTVSLAIDAGTITTTAAVDAEFSK